MKIKTFIKTTFRALRYRNFRLFYFGQCISLIGTWMQRTAQTWLVYTLTNSPLMVGLVGVAQFLPLLLFSLFAGVIVDRFRKKRLLLVTQFLFLFQAVTMTLLTYSGLVRIWHILALSFLFGLTQTLDMPTRQSFFIDLVGTEDLTNAISLNSTIVNLARIIGPAVSGMVMVAFTIQLCFLINAISYIPVIAGILLIRVKNGENTRQVGNSNMLPQILEGLHYIRQNRTLVVNVLVMAVVCTFAMNNDVVIPVFAREVLGRGANGYSFLLSMAGLGSFIAALMMAYLSKNGVHRSFLIYSGVATGALQVLTLAVRQYAFCAVLIAFIGFFSLLFINTANSIFQMNSSNEFRGRVMSVYSFLNLGSTPIGNFLVGTVMERAGGGSGFVFCGGVALSLLCLIFLGERSELLTWLKTGAG